MEQRCNQLRSATAHLFEWEWDGRFGCVLAQFGIANEQQLLDILGGVFSDRWTSSTIGDAGEAIRTICDELGGLRPGQFLFTTESEPETMLVGAWWPWGNGKTISIRVLLHGESVDEEALTLFKSWFV